MAGDCPNENERCSQFTNASTTICVPINTKTANCPITDLKFVVKTDMGKYNLDPSDTSKPLYKVVNYTETSSILYST